MRQIPLAGLCGLLLLAGCGSQKIDGAIVVPHNGTGDPNAMGSSCAVQGRFGNVVTSGKTIVIKNGKGEILGAAELEEGRQILGEMTDRDKQLLQDPAVVKQLGLVGKTFVGCEFPFTVSVQPSDIYVVSMDGLTGDLVQTKQKIAENKGRLIFTVK